MASSGLDSLYKAQKELVREHLNAYVCCLGDLKAALDRQGVRVYPAAPLAGTADIGSLFGIRVYVDEGMPPHQIEMRDSLGRVLKRFTLL